MTQLSRANFKTTKNTRFADNTTRDITEQDSRDMYEDTADSAVFKTDDISTNADFAVDGTKLTDRATIKTLVDAGGGMTRTDHFESDHFIGGAVSNTWSNSNSGTGAVVSGSTYGIDATQKVIGAVYLGTGTTTTGRSSLYRIYIKLTFAAFIIKWRCALAVLSDATNNYIVHLGLIDNHASNSDPVTGVFFRYNHALSTGNWQAVCETGSTETVVDTSVLAAITNYVNFEIQINTAATQAIFIINGSTVATINTNLPTISDFVYLAIKIRKTAGTTDRHLHLDYASLNSVI